MNTVERIKSICKEQKIAISKLEKDCGFANGYIGQLRKGVVPDDRLRIIADYLELSIEYLMTGKTYIPSEADAYLDARIASDFTLKAAIEKYYTLSEAKKKHVIELINLLAED